MTQFRLKSLRLEGFQPFEDITFELGDVTVISGFSDSGKSSVVRAFNALVSGGIKQDQIKKGAAVASITVVRDDGKVLILERIEGSGSTFTIGNVQLSRVGNKTPEEVFEFLGWEPIQIDKDLKLSPFIASQHDQPLLLNAPPSQMAKAFAKMTGAHILHAAIRLAVSKELVLQRDVDFANRELTKATTEAEKFINLPAKTVLANEARGLFEELKAVRKKQVLLSEVSHRDISFHEALRVEEKLEERVRALHELLKKYKKVDEKYTLLKTASVEIPDLKSTEARVIYFKDRVDLLLSMYSTSKRISYSKAEYNNKASEGRSVIQQINELKEELSAFKVCPECQRPFDD